VSGPNALGEYLLSLTAPRTGSPRRPRRETVPTGIRQLLDAVGLPAFVESPMFDVLAPSALATALSPSIRPRENRLWSMFLDEGERDLHPDREHSDYQFLMIRRIARARHDIRPTCQQESRDCS
jgi:hypothetical protein